MERIYRVTVRDEVCKLAAQVGSDLLLTQGAGGNVSWKSDGLMWIRASGTRLRDAIDEEIFVPVSLTEFQQSLRSGDFSVSPLVLCETELRPSIETSLHALLPQDVVLHVHAVEALSVLVRVDAQETARSQMPYLDSWAFVPYAKPGAELARALSAAMAENPNAWAYLLESHGVVVAGSTAAEVFERLHLILEGLGSSNRQQIEDCLPVSGLNYRKFLPEGIVQLEHESFDWLVKNVSREELESEWALYPDHVVFLGPIAPVLQEGDSIFEAIRRHGFGFTIVVGSGVFCLPEFSSTAEEQLICYAEVLRRQSPGNLLNLLSDRDVAELVGWESEKLRVARAK